MCCCVPCSSAGALRRLALPACASSLCVVAWQRCSSPCCLRWVPFGVAHPPPSGVSGGFFFSARRVLAGSAPPGFSWCPPLCFGVRRVVWCCGLYCVSCGAPCCVACLCGVGFLRRVVRRGIVLGPVFVVLCCRALLRSLLVFFFRVVPYLSVVLRAVTVSVLCSCGAVLVCLRRCALRGALLPLLRWLVCCSVSCLRVCCLAWLSSVVSWWVLGAPGVVIRWCAALCPWVLCCAVLLRVGSPGVVLLCAVLFCFALFGAVARCVVSWGAVSQPAVLCLPALCFVLSPRAGCVQLWCVAAWCCLPLCFVPCASWGVVLCVPCPLRPVRCCCAPLSLVPCPLVLCPVLLWCRVVLWCPVLLPCLVCFLCLFGLSYLKNRCKICY